MTVRSARLDELGTFYELWEEFMAEHNPLAGVPEDNTEFMNRGGKLFQTYVGGTKMGACHFWVDQEGTPQGFFLSGEPLGFFDMFQDMEKCSIVYGEFIRKPFRGSAGLELAMEAARIDGAKGFVTGCTVVKVSNAKGRRLIERTGAKLIDMRYSFVLEDVAKLGEPNG